ncbi:MAG: cytochrome-c peroxidase [Myxococcota bacterium]|nr:cytochrome-c peroxidase [Myxococcota bacterium]
MPRIRALTIAGALLFAACGSSSSEPEVTGAETPPAAAAPTAAAAAPVIEPLAPVQTDARKVTLGRALFHDVRLSGDETISCATCHSLDAGGAEPRPTSIGIRGQVGPINSPTVLNAGLGFVQFWDGRAADLQAQAAGPVTNPLEMGATWEQVTQRLSADAALTAEMTAIYGENAVTQANITDAIAEYERSLVTPSRFDAFLRGDASALTDDERRGYETFQEVGCTSCHRGQGVGGTMYQRMGLVRRTYFEDRGTPITDADRGRFNVTQQESDLHFFKVPILRNVALTAPYLHDGSQRTLEDVVRVMGRYQLGRELDADQVRVLVAFLSSLTGELPAHARMPASAVPPTPAPAPTAAPPPAAAP